MHLYFVSFFEFIETSSSIISAASSSIFAMFLYLPLRAPYFSPHDLLFHLVLDGLEKRRICSIYFSGLRKASLFHIFRSPYKFRASVTSLVNNARIPGDAVEKSVL